MLNMIHSILIYFVFAFVNFAVGIKIIRKNIRDENYSDFDIEDSKNMLVCFTFLSFLGTFVFLLYLLSQYINNLVDDLIEYDPDKEK